MQTPAAPSPAAAAAAAAAERPPARRVVRLAGVLAELFGHGEGAGGSKDELLLCLRVQGLITYPSPLLGRLLQELPEVLAAEVMPLLPPADRASLAEVACAWRDAAYPGYVFPEGLPRAETPGAVRVFKIVEFLRSVERLAQARDNGCPWEAKKVAPPLSRET